jgi:hypothetical protein
MTEKKAGGLLCFGYMWGKFCEKALLRPGRKKILNAQAAFYWLISP